MWSSEASEDLLGGEGCVHVSSLLFWFKVLSLFLSNATHGFLWSALQRPFKYQLRDFCLLGCRIKFAAKN